MRTRQRRSSSDSVTSGHRSVLLHETIDILDIQPNDTVIDATLGGAGHAKELASRLSEKGTFVGFDLDNAALARAQAALKNAQPRVHLIEGNFRSMRNLLVAYGIERFSKAVFDLGWSSYQLSTGKGFSFLADEPLLMNYSDAPGALTASEIVNEWEEDSIADVIFGWGEERYARRIARAIVSARESHPITAARELGEIVRSAVPQAYARGRIHPATKTFQALRIAVNDELGALEDALKDSCEMLAVNGRVAFITFHSLEDRMVKQHFAALEKAGTHRRIHKKPIVPSEEELRGNPRARSAKLRALERII